METRYPATGTRVDVGRGAIHVLDRAQRGEPRGAVLMIHGASGNAADLDVALADRLSEAGFRVLSVDRPGHGWSARVGGGQGSSPVLQAEAILRAAQGLGVTQAIVVGHSLGCVTSLALALEAPDFVRALTLIAPVSHPWPGGVAWYYNVGAHPLFGPPFRRLLTLPVGMAWMASAVKGVFAPNPAPPNFVEATRLPLVLRPLHFRANCEDVAHTEAAVGALSPRYPRDPRPDRDRHRRFRQRRLRPYPFGRMRARHSRRAAHDARRRRPFAPPRCARTDRRDHPRGRAARAGARDRDSLKRRRRAPGRRHKITCYIRYYLPGLRRRQKVAVFGA